jgi:hypothetical protein
MTVQCREGHESTELDYCSVCGVPMLGKGGADERPGSLGGSPSKGSPSNGPEACPSCGEPRTFAEARFCEVCRYDFVTQKGGPPPAVVAVVAAAPLPQEPNVPLPAWELVVSVDPALDTDPDPANPCPKGEAEQVFGVDEEEILVGRRDDRRDIRPDIPVGDPGTSRRHAKFLKSADGSVSVQDLSPLNGTRLNETDMVPGSRQVLKEGDAVTLGRWTRIRLRRKP